MPEVVVLLMMVVPPLTGAIVACVKAMPRQAAVFLLVTVLGALVAASSTNPAQKSPKLDFKHGLTNTR